MKTPFAIPVSSFPLKAMGFDRMNAKDVCRHLFDRASDILVRDKQLDSVVFLLTEKNCIAISAMNFMKDGETKDALSFLLRKAAGETSIIGVALVMEGYMRPATEEEKRTGMVNCLRP